MKTKTLSNLLKLAIILFAFFEYHFQSLKIGRPLNSDECGGLLRVAIAGFAMLFPIDSSIFIKNYFSFKNKKDNNEN